MADDEKIGRDWSDDELDLIVADYFAMLAAEEQRRPYVKSHHRVDLMEQIGRTKRSVEFKHMNISAVLHELGLPWIGGYKPKFNYQRSIFPAIDRYLSAHPEVLDYEPRIDAALSDPPSLFVEAPPPLVNASFSPPEELKRLVRKFDPVDRDFRSRALGKAGEEFVVDDERRRLNAIDRPDLARKVRWVSQEDGDGAGFDILSFDRLGSERLIEVKTTRGAKVTPFFLTRNEHSLARERPDAFRLYRLFHFSRSPRMFELVPPLDDALYLETATYRASFRGRL